MVRKHGLVVIGDHPTRPSERGMNYAARVNEHLKNCSGIVLLFPHRDAYKQSTSSAMFIELLLAAKYRLPTLIFFEEGVQLAMMVGANDTAIAFGPSDSRAEAAVTFGDISLHLADNEINSFNSSFIINTLR